MQIAFEKVGSTPKFFKEVFEGIELVGTLKKSGNHQVMLDAVLSGEMRLDCDRCGKSYRHNIDTKLQLKLTDIICKDKDDLDIIEFLDGKIDMQYILQSEIASIESLYHYCNSCDNDDEFEMEF